MREGCYTREDEPATGIKLVRLPFPLSRPEAERQGGTRATQYLSWTIESNSTGLGIRECKLEADKREYQVIDGQMNASKQMVPRGEREKKKKNKS
ncbi:hypothetical protein HI914_06248 [Erysiphe necator]|nr:hypothetical protein HI914_06248 [Erysiphe necator]